MAITCTLTDADGGTEVRLVHDQIPREPLSSRQGDAVYHRALSWAYSGPWPRGAPHPLGWRVIAENHTTNSRAFSAHAVCMLLGDDLKRTWARAGA